MTILNRTRLFWKADFSTILAKQYPELYNAHLNSIKPTGPQPGLCFKKLNYRTYEISFQDAQGNRGIKEMLEIGLQLEVPTEEAVPETLSPSNLLMTNPPSSSSQIRGVRSRDFKGRHVDFAENETVSKECGKAGEFLVVEYEKDSLIEFGHRDLADKVIHTSETEGDGAGYDIQSYTPKGEIKYIEVKTTSGGPGTPFMLSVNELAFSKQHPGNYCLYRIYDYSKSAGKGKFYVIHGDLSEHFTLDPVQFKARR